MVDKDEIKRKLAAGLAPRGKQKELADFVGTSEAAVSKWVRTGEISRDNIIKVCEFFKEPVSWLMGGETAKILEFSPNPHEQMYTAFADVVDFVDDLLIMQYDEDQPIWEPRTRARLYLAVFLLDQSYKGNEVRISRRVDRDKVNDFIAKLAG